MDFHSQNQVEPLVSPHVSRTAQKRKNILLRNKVIENDYLNIIIELLGNIIIETERIINKAELLKIQFVQAQVHTHTHTHTHTRRIF